MTKAKSKTYTAAVDSSERVLAGGQVATPGQSVSLDDEAQKDPHNKRLIETGQLRETPEEPSNGGEK